MRLVPEYPLRHRRTCHAHHINRLTHHCPRPRRLGRRFQLECRHSRAAVKRPEGRGRAKPSHLPCRGRGREDGNGFVYLSEQAFIDDVAQDLPSDTARLLAVTQGPLAKRTFADALTKTAWRTRPSWFIVSASDRAVSPDLQRDAAKLMGSTVTEVPSSHMSLISHADEVIEAIVLAAETAARG